MISDSGLYTLSLLHDFLFLEDELYSAPNKFQKFLHVLHEMQKATQNG